MDLPRIVQAAPSHRTLLQQGVEFGVSKAALVLRHLLGQRAKRRVNAPLPRLRKPFLVEHLDLDAGCGDAALGRVTADPALPGTGRRVPGGAPEKLDEIGVTLGFADQQREGIFVNRTPTAFRRFREGRGCGGLVEPPEPPPFEHALRERSGAPESSGRIGRSGGHEDERQRFAPGHLRYLEEISCGVCRQ